MNVRAEYLQYISHTLNPQLFLQQLISILHGYNLAIQALKHLHIYIGCMSLAGLVFKQSDTITLQINQYQKRNNPTSNTQLDKSVFHQYFCWTSTFNIYDCNLQVSQYTSQDKHCS